MPPILPLAAAALFAFLGALALIAGRREERPRFTLAGVGRISHVTLHVSGFAALAIAYHLVAYTLGLDAFRAPWWLAVSIALVAVLMSLLIDAIEGSRSRD